MMVKLFRAAFLGAALLMSATTLSFADDPVTLPTNILTQLNTAAANQSPADYAVTVASLVKDNPTLAALIAGKATEIKPGAAIAITTQVAGVVTSTSEAHDVAAAIVANASAGDKSSITSTFIANAPANLQGPMTIALADVGGSAPAGGKPGGGNTGGTKDVFKAPGSPPPPVS
jgi:hypothetical protein